MILRLFARQRRLVEQLMLTARNQTRMPIDARDQTMRIVGHSETRERPETRRHRMRIHLGRAREAHHRVGIANVQQLIGPIAAVDALVVGQTRLAVLLMRNAVGALDEAGGALRTVRIDAELVFAAGRRDWCRIVFALAAIDRPVVVAVIVNGTFAVEQQSVFARFQRQRAVGAQEELVAELGVAVRLDAVLFGAFGGVDGGCVGWGRTN